MMLLVRKKLKGKAKQGSCNKQDNFFDFCLLISLCAILKTSFNRYCYRPPCRGGIFV